MDEGPVILFDGVCVFCNSAVHFIIRRDKRKVFRFAPLQSAAGRLLLNKYGLSETEINSFVLIDNGKAYTKTNAALKVAGYFSPLWGCTKICWLVPARVRDVMYNLIARNRYRWFGKKEICMVPPPELRSRFLE